jgi:hypothetical protein
MTLPLILYVCPSCFAADREPGQCEHHGARAMVGPAVDRWPPSGERVESRRPEPK